MNWLSYINLIKLYSFLFFCFKILRQFIYFTSCLVLIFLFVVCLDRESSGNWHLFNFNRSVYFVSLLAHWLCAVFCRERLEREKAEKEKAERERERAERERMEREKQEKERKERERLLEQREWEQQRHQERERILRESADTSAQAAVDEHFVESFNRVAKLRVSSTLQTCMQTFVHTGVCL